MIYGQDEPMLFPVADLYDSTMMKMYIDAAKEQYNQNREDMKEFMKEYGDFMSPFANDIAWVDQQTRGRINAAMQYMQQNGIDPLRSAEGRSILQNIINTTDRAGINIRKQSAERRLAYDKAVQQMKLAGTYNKDFVDWDFKQRYGITPDQWDTERNGIWQDTSPEIYKDLNEYTGHIFDNMKDDYINTVDGYDYFGISRERRAGALTPQIEGLLNSQLGRYHYENSRRNAEAILGRKPTEQEVLEQYKNDILTATEEYEHRIRSENPERARAQEFHYSDLLDQRKSARDLHNTLAAQESAWKLEHTDVDEDGNLVYRPGGKSGKGSSSSSSSEYSDDDSLSWSDEIAESAMANSLNPNHKKQAGQIVNELRQKLLEYDTNKNKKTGKTGLFAPLQAAVSSIDPFKMTGDKERNAIITQYKLRLAELNRDTRTVQSKNSFGANVLSMSDNINREKNEAIGEGDYLPFSFSGKNIQFTPLRNLQSEGHSYRIKAAKDGIYNKFNEWLTNNKIHGNLPTDNTTYTYHVDNTIDVNGYGAIPYSKFKEFVVKVIGDKDEDENIQKRAKELGVIIRDPRTKTANGKSYEAGRVVWVPITRTIAADGGQGMGVVNQMYDAYMTSHAISAKRQLPRQLDSAGMRGRNLKQVNNN